MQRSTGMADGGRELIREGGVWTRNRQGASPWVDAVPNGSASFAFVRVLSFGSHVAVDHCRPLPAAFCQNGQFGRGGGRRLSGLPP